ncbi:MAG: archaeosortase/exosortase family protein [Thermoplasmata archaeon]
MRATDRLKLVIGLVLLFGGLNLALLLSHLSRLYGIALIMAGLGVLLWAARGMEAPSQEKGEPDNLASRVIRIITLRGRLHGFLPVFGIGIIITVIAYNLLMSDSGYLGSNDYVALFLAGTLLAYNYVPEKYLAERDFALLFSILLFAFLVVPTTLLQYTSTGDDTNSPITYYLLAMPTATLSGLLGVHVISPVADLQTGLTVYNWMELTGPDGFPITLNIALSCSGLYSVAIFVSAFIAFVSIEYRKFDRKVAMLLGIGMLLAWVANIIRMTIIVLVGHYEGPDAMVWVHNNAGEFIFMAWVALFWWFMFWYFGVLEQREEKPAKPAKARGKCAICHQPLSPSIPSSKCECGAISHSGCLLTEGMRCPSCGAEMDIGSDEL